MPDVPVPRPEKHCLEQLFFSNGVRATRRLIECPFAILGGHHPHSQPHRAVSYKLIGWGDRVLSEVVRCEMPDAPEEVVPVHEAAAVIMNRDPATRDTFRGFPKMVQRAAAFTRWLALTGREPQQPPFVTRITTNGELPVPADASGRADDAPPGDHSDV